MKTIPASEFQRLLAAQPSLPVLDVRTPAEFDEVHVTAAQNVPLGELQPKALYDAGKLPAGQSVYLLCRSGARATKAAEQFAAQGYADTIVVEGGTLACVEGGVPVTRGTTTVMSLERQVRVAAGAIVLIGFILGHWVYFGFHWLSAFIGAGLVFSGLTDWCGMGILLAMAPWNQRKSAGASSAP